MVRNSVRLITRELMLVILSIITGTVLLVAVNYIPRGRMTGHVRESAAILHEEGWHPQIWQGINETYLDNSTDGLMINTAYTRSGDALQDIFLNTSVKIAGTNGLEALYEVMCNENTDYEIRTYGRYWHGYQIFLSPLLLVFNIAEIRQFNTLMQLLMIALLVNFMMKKNDTSLVLPFLIMYFFLCPVSLFSSLQFSTSFYVMLFSIMALLINENGGGGGQSQYILQMIFTLAGIMTAYFDLLTYPFIIPGVLLITHFAVSDREEDEERIRTYIIELSSCSISWGIGYGGMWVGKWIIASCFTHENVISEALERIRFRGGSVYKDEVYTWMGTLQSNLDVCNKTVLAVIFTLLVLGTMSYRIINNSWVRKTALCRMGAIMVVSLYPCIWYRLTMNHSSIHAWFMTWRELAITVYGITVILCMNLHHTQKV